MPKPWQGDGSATAPLAPPAPASMDVDLTADAGAEPDSPEGSENGQGAAAEGQHSTHKAVQSDTVAAWQKKYVWLEPTGGTGRNGHIQVGNEGQLPMVCLNPCMPLHAPPLHV